MIRLNQIKMPIEHTEGELRRKAASVLRVGEQDICSFKIAKKSLDARKKPQLFFLYSIDVTVQGEKRLYKHLPKDCTVVQEEPYRIPVCEGIGEEKKNVIVGDGPAGLFCAYLFALCGIPAVLIERGQPVEERTRAVEDFWKTGKLMPESNVQFGEGGAGTFSDGKLNTLVKDKTGKNRFVLETFVRFGAPEEILYEAKPHIGTDILKEVISSMRAYLLAHGIRIRFETKMTGLQLRDECVAGVIIQTGEIIPADYVVLAIGHSARDTFEKLYEQGIHMEPKAFAVGLRVEHPRKFINVSQYGLYEHDALPAASYKLTAQTSGGRGVYSFCMCPGGYVVNASSEEGRLAVNGMSYHDRGGDNSNSAVIVTVTPDDFEGDGPLAGVAFQRKLEEKAYKVGKGAIPVESFGDFARAVGQESPSDRAVNDMIAEMEPATKGVYVYAPVHEILPKALNEALVEGMHQFGHKIRGFDDPGCILSGVESRTSSPVRIARTQTGESVNVKGLFPCGEGAGYAGGIMSAAMDGLNIAEKIIEMQRERICRGM